MDQLPNVVQFLAAQLLVVAEPPLSEAAGWQDRVKRHVMEDLGTVCPYVQILDLPVPQMVGDVTDTLRILDLPVAEQEDEHTEEVFSSSFSFSSWEVAGPLPPCARFGGSERQNKQNSTVACAPRTPPLLAPASSPSPPSSAA